MSAVKIAGIAVKTATIKELAHERRAHLIMICLVLEILLLSGCLQLPRVNCLSFLSIPHLRVGNLDQSCLPSTNHRPQKVWLHDITHTF